MACFSVAERIWNIESVGRAAMWEERWRYKHLKTDDPVNPRQIVIDHLLSPHMTPFDIVVDSSSAYTFDPTLPSSKYFRTLEHIPDFVDLPTHELLTTWRVVVAGAWKYHEVIHVTEARSVLLAARRLCRVRCNFGRLHLMCCDMFGAALAFSWTKTFQLSCFCLSRRLTKACPHCCRATMVVCKSSTSAGAIGLHALWLVASLSTRRLIVSPRPGWACSIWSRQGAEAVWRVQVSPKRATYSPDPLSVRTRAWSSFKSLTTASARLQAAWSRGPDG